MSPSLEASEGGIGECGGDCDDECDGDRGGVVVSCGFVCPESMLNGQ